MIALLSYSINSLANDGDTIPSTGRQDSVLIAYDDLRKVNSKLIELEYERNINEHLRTIISNDSIAINSLRTRIDNIQRDCDRNIKRVKKQMVKKTPFPVSCFSLRAYVLHIIPNRPSKI